MELSERHREIATHFQNGIGTGLEPWEFEALMAVLAAYEQEVREECAEQARAALSATGEQPK